MLATLCRLHCCVSETPTGQLPVLHLDGQPLVEHLAIARLLAKRAGWYGRDDRRDYLADSLADAVSTGFRWGVLPAVCVTTDELAEAALPSQLSPLEPQTAREVRFWTS